MRIRFNYPFVSLQSLHNGEIWSFFPYEVFPNQHYSTQKEDLYSVSMMTITLNNSIPVDDELGKLEYRHVPRWYTLQLSKPKQNIIALLTSFITNITEYLSSLSILNQRNCFFIHCVSVRWQVHSLLTFGIFDSNSIIKLYISFFVNKRNGLSQKNIRRKTYIQFM